MPHLIPPLCPLPPSPPPVPLAPCSGSLTTPPCSTGVDWYVFMDTLQVDANQILDFMYFAGSQVKPGNNARPPQPIQNRDLRFFA